MNVRQIGAQTRNFFLDGFCLLIWKEESVSAR